MAIRLAVLVLSLAMCGAQAQTPIAPALRKPVQLDSVRIVEGSAAYPAGLAAKGVQGAVEISAEMSSEGKFSEVKIATSSRSAELDSAALALVPKLSVKLDAGGKGPEPGLVILPVEYARDSVTNIARKHCADFNVDADYFKTTFPEKSVLDMPVFTFTTGILFFKVKREQQLALAKNSKKIDERIVEECGKLPERLFLEVALESAHDAL